MVTEGEIALTILQLAGATVPILLGITGFYLKNKSEVIEAVRSHPDTVARDDLPPDLVERVISNYVGVVGILLLAALFFAVSELVPYVENTHFAFLSTVAYGLALVALILAGFTLVYFRFFKLLFVFIIVVFAVFGTVFIIIAFGAIWFREALIAVLFTGLATIAFGFVVWYRRYLQQLDASDDSDPDPDDADPNEVVE